MAVWVSLLQKERIRGKKFNWATREDSTSPMVSWIFKRILRLGRYCTPNQKIACCVLYLILSTPLWKIVNSSCIKLSKKLKKWHQDPRRPSASWIIDKNIISTVLINKLKNTIFTIKILMPYLSSLDGQFPFKCMSFFFFFFRKRCLQFWDRVNTFMKNSACILLSKELYIALKHK